MQSLLPDKLKKGLIKTDWRFVPSAELGGDSFGYHWLDDDHFAFYLLDVSGHGVGAAPQRRAADRGRQDDVAVQRVLIGPRAGTTAQNLEEIDQLHGARPR